jgi:hypothetical protein
VLRFVALLALIGAATAYEPATAAPTSASVRVASTKPVTIRGGGFSAYERVRVTVTTETRMTKRIRTRASGTFTVAFTGLRYDRCTSGLTIAARGTRHSAILKIPLAQCTVP